jgi:hypothetical protein
MDAPTLETLQNSPSVITNNSSARTMCAVAQMLCEIRTSYPSRRLS